jgi:hypothetical protein
LYRIWFTTVFVPFTVDAIDMADSGVVESFRHFRTESGVISVILSIYLEGEDGQMRNDRH